MSSTRALLQATLIRLQSRLGSGLADAFAEVMNQAETAGSRLQQELQLFREEVEAEADRLDNNGGACSFHADPSTTATATATASAEAATAAAATATADASRTHSDTSDCSTDAGHGVDGKPVSMADVQNTIDTLRAEVAELSRRLEQSTR